MNTDCLHRGTLRLRGGRAGNIDFEHEDIRGQLGWEMLVGPIAGVVYAADCHWTAPEPRPMQRNEILILVQRLASKLNVSFEVAFSDGSEIIQPTSAA